MTDKQIQEWQEKVRTTFGEESKMYEYLFETMDNFYYRYLETTVDKNLKTASLGPHLWGAKSTETSMVDALKITNPVAKKGIIELAKSVPKSEGPAVQYELLANVEELSADRGEIHLVSVINWGWPDFENPEKQFKKTVVFKYSDLGEFRKNLALKLEEACEAFL
ncbi:MAG: hypothetical protein ACLGHN_11540 [Bacteriovoracia bacterium]